MIIRRKVVFIYDLCLLCCNNYVETIEVNGKHQKATTVKSCCFLLTKEINMTYMYIGGRFQPKVKKKMIITFTSNTFNFNFQKKKMLSFEI